MDKYRLVMPPALFLILATPFWKLAHTVFFYNWYAATAVYCGGIFGYVCYDMTHYFLHHKTYAPRALPVQTSPNNSQPPRILETTQEVPFAASLC